MSNSSTTPPLEPWLLPDGHLPAKPEQVPLSVIKEPDKKGKEAKPPEPPEPPELSEDERRLHDFRTSGESDAIQNLVQTTRGVSLILWSLHDKESDDFDWNGVVSGLSSVLKTAADDADATYFGSVGELADTLKPEILILLLKKKLAQLEAKIAADQQN